MVRDGLLINAYRWDTFYLLGSRGRRSLLFHKTALFVAGLNRCSLATLAAFHKPAFGITRAVVGGFGRWCRGRNL
jgi:hypothetical protein